MALKSAPLLVLACAAAALVSMAQEFEPEVAPLPSDPANYAPLERFEAMKVPADNPMTAEKAALGRQLFFDARLSGDGKLSCYSCHLNEKGLTDGKAIGEGAFGKKLTRSSPTLWNVGYLAEWYWDGRAKTLEAQAAAAWTKVNMGASKPEEITAKLNAIAGYKKQFQKVFGGDATPDNVAKALACYMRTIISQTTVYDKSLKDPSAASDAEKRGYDVFKRAKCDNCHSGVMFADKQFHNVGIGMKAEKPDVGRFTVSKAEKDTGAFRTPTLRDVARSAPYFHDGSAATLEEAVKIMVGGGIDNPHLDKTNLVKTEVTADEMKDLIEFLKSLTETAEIKAPKLP